jgi:predicted alpha/beta-fold hydrolase
MTTGTTRDKALQLRALPARARHALHGHYWTYAGYVLSKLEKIEVDDAPIVITLDDEVAGRIELDARFHNAESDHCVVVFHGLGGSLESRYVQLAVRAAQRAGLSTLRVSFRGANGKGADVYHAGLTDDVRAALRCPELARMKHLTLIGYSMGGHITLRYASESRTRGIDERVRAVSAVCAPLDLRKCVDAIQRRDRLPYQYNVLKTLKEHYRAVEEKAARSGRKLAHPWQEVNAVTTIDVWDKLVVCPRFGFPDIDTYYRACSVGPHLHAMEVPTLLAIANADPMVPRITLDPWIQKTSKSVEVRRFDQGGHVAFPKGVAVGASLEDDIVAWLMAR